LNRRRIRNLVHWKVMILLTIFIWIGISKVAASSDPTNVEEPIKQGNGEVTPHEIDL